MAFQDVKEILRTALPEPIFAGLRQAFNFCRPGEIDKVQTTIYLNTATSRTYIGVNNFYSWLGADQIVNAHIKVVFHDKAGTPRLTIKKPLCFFGSCMLDVR